MLGNSTTQSSKPVLQLVGRFFWGMATGVYTVLVPKFITETAPNELKGPFGAISQLLVTLGIFVAAQLAIRIPYFTFQETNGCSI